MNIIFYGVIRAKSDNVEIESEIFTFAALVGAIKMQLYINAEWLLMMLDENITHITKCLTRREFIIIVGGEQ